MCAEYAVLDGADAGQDARQLFAGFFECRDVNTRQSRLVAGPQVVADVNQKLEEILEADWIIITTFLKN